MKVLAQTEYQDMYRVKDGVLLVVNKFIPMKIDGVEHPIVYANWNESRSYVKGCQKQLKVLKKDYIHEASWCEPEWIVLKGTVIYEYRPVKSTKDKSKWKYEIKTTGSCLSGDIERINELLNDILNVINEE